MMKHSTFDLLIIGAGVIGCAIARELSKYRLSIAVLEKAADVGWGTSCRNSGVVHAGLNNKTGSFMARFCVEGNQGFEAFCKPLDVPYDKQGKLIVSRNAQETAILERLKAQGDANGVRDLAIVDSHEMKRLEPNVEGVAALYCPETAITSPYLLTIALAENALANGVEFFLNHEVQKIERWNSSRRFEVHTPHGIFNSSYLINSAGLYCDKIAAMAGVKGYRIYPCRGEYHILDKHASELISRPVYPAPLKGAGGLGVHFTTTIGGVILIGPSAEYIQKRDNLATTQQIMKRLFEEGQSFLPQISAQTIIRSYSGLRAKQAPPSEGGFRDFVIEERPERPGMLNLIGIESPGLTSAEPIAKRVAMWLDRKEKLEPNPDFTPCRTGILKFDAQDEVTKRNLIHKNPDYGEIICRCENITRQEVLDAVRNPLGARSLNSIKYRTRAMMGRCQGGYCLSRLIDILVEECGMQPEEIQLDSRESALFTGYRS